MAETSVVTLLGDLSCVIGELLSESESRSFYADFVAAISMTGLKRAVGQSVAEGSLEFHLE